ncbi:hypothetical protein [Pseudonocardia nigra]|uniref:hypothetical protein n=1 Tax=Pseudonocardia nigra TaxID=1921578 RepID=UPI001C5E31B5|nr:hypothetical protein [Pseudonocardia nigra]
MPNERVNIPHVLDDPPPFHQKLLDYGERPYWSADGSRIAFIEQNYGDACEIDLATDKVRNLTKDLGDHHSFLRVLILSNGDYLLIGPAKFKDRDVSRRVESELWVLDKNLNRPPKPLGRRIAEGAGVSAREPRITYAVTGRNDPSIGGPDVHECHVTDIAYGDEGPGLGQDRVFYRTRAGAAPEPQDFRHDDTEVIFAEYSHRRVAGVTPDARCVVKGYWLDNGEFTTYITESMVHNEPEGIFPDQEHICLESSCDNDSDYPPQNLWKLKLDGSQERVRMTSMPADRTWKATNSNVSPDGRWLAFMVALQSDESGYGRGLGLLDLHAWGQSPESQQWETPTSRAQAQHDPMPRSLS